MKTLLEIFSLLLIPVNALANSGYSVEGAGGLEFSKSEHISLEKETLTISPNKIEIDYVFYNSSEKDINATVAFPMPNIKCGWFEINEFPDNFITTIDDKPIQYNVEKKAIFTGERSDLYKKDQDVTNILTNNQIPTDCRDIEKKRLTADDIDNKNISESHIKLIKLGLAEDVINYKDVWSINYKTIIKYYWNQKFPAKSIINIHHSYRPSFGAGNKGLNYEYEKDILDNVESYKSIYKSDLKLSLLTDKYTGANGYILLTYILKTANTWKGPIKTFELRFRKPENFLVSNIAGNMSLENGDIVIKRRNFMPLSDLKAAYFSTTNYVDDIIGVDRKNF